IADQEIRPSLQVLGDSHAYRIRQNRAARRRVVLGKCLARKGRAVRAEKTFIAARQSVFILPVDRVDGPDFDRMPLENPRQTPVEVMLVREIVIWAEPRQISEPII